MLNLKRASLHRYKTSNSSSMRQYCFLCHNSSPPPLTENCLFYEPSLFCFYYITSLPLFTSAAVSFPDVLLHYSAVHYSSFGLFNIQLCLFTLFCSLYPIVSFVCQIGFCELVNARYTDCCHLCDVEILYSNPVQSPLLWIFNLGVNDGNLVH